MKARKFTYSVYGQDYEPPSPNNPVYVQP